MRTFDANTSQKNLQELTRKALVSEFMRRQPISLTGIRYIILFTLFPGMALGFKLGLIITGILALSLMVLIGMGEQALSVEITRWYLIVGCSFAAMVCLRVLWLAITHTRAAARYQTGQAGISKADAALSEAGKTLRLQWKRVGENGLQVASPVVRIEERGIYLFLAEIKGGVWLTQPATHVSAPCLCQFSGAELPSDPKLAKKVKGRALMHRSPLMLFAFRFEPGLHRIELRAAALKGEKLEVTLTRQND